MAPVCTIVIQLGNLLASESHQCHVSLHFFDSFEECHWVKCRQFVLIHSHKSMLPGLVSCRSMFKSKLVIFCQPLQYCQPLRQFVLYYSVTPISYNRFRVVDVGFIMALLRRICSCRLQIIIQESNLETTPVPKSLHASMASFFVFVHGLTSLALEWRIPPVFDFKSFIHTCRFVLRHLGNHWHQWWFSSHLLTVYINDR
jgi:hypothetical protein